MKILNKENRDSIKIKQREISTNEVYNIWELLNARYDAIHTTKLFLEFVVDTDLELILKKGLDLLKKQSEELEEKLTNYGIPFPKKPPEKIAAATDVEEITDEFVFRTIFKQIQGFIPIEHEALVKSSKREIRTYIRQMLNKELNVYDRLFEYGKLKGWLYNPPRYRD